MIRLLTLTQDTMQLGVDDLLSLEEARFPASALAMRPLNPQHVQVLAESPIEEWPPVLVTAIDQGYVLIDGRHRREAARIRGSQWIHATCQAFETINEVIEACFRANLKHGLPTSMETRGDYAYWLHATYPELVQAELARRTGLTQSGVSRALAKREQEAQHAVQEGPATDTVLVDLEVQREAAKRWSRRLTREVLHFFAELAVLDDQELAQILVTSLKTPQERASLLRLARLLASQESERQAS